jgi:hypothetical protein
MSTRQEEMFRNCIENVVLSIDLAVVPESPVVMTDADKVSVLIPQIRAQLEGCLAENRIDDEHVLDNLSARKAQATGTEADELQAVIDLYSH